MKAATAAYPPTRQDELGQFLTSAPVADFMASMFGPLPETVRLLDPGAGAGALTAAFVRHAIRSEARVRNIRATLYEIDGAILDELSATMRECKLQCAEAGLEFSFTIHAADFIHETSARFTDELSTIGVPTFDAAIANPPYRKISVDSAARRSLRSVGIETSNLYTGFIALVQRLLRPGGQLVGITPRSFCNGPYFRPFREDFLRSLSLQRLHVFESRQAAFRHDSVLQENIIFHAVKGTRQPDMVSISSSSGNPGAPITTEAISFGEVVHPADVEKFIHIPSNAGHAAAKTTLSTLTTSLASLGVGVSTGRVVDFRLKETLRMEPEPGTVPLLYPSHFTSGAVCWPKRGGRKPNAIVDNDETRPWLVPRGTYLLTKRFTSKEERRRLVACLFDPVSVEASWVGFENHLNYFHSAGRGLERGLALGLFVFLNSTVVDQYFRRFSGHTQVNATDLRTLNYPDKLTLLAIGRAVTALNIAQEEIDRLLSQHLNGSR